MRWHPTEDELTQEVLQGLFVYDEATGQLLRKVSPRSDRIGEPAGTIGKAGYVSLSIGCKHFYAHRIIWRMLFGVWPSHIDHINRIRSDNRIENLREADKLTNRWNFGLSKRNTSGAIGVSWAASEEKWVARIMVRRRYIHLGCFDDKDEAIKAYKAASIKHRGEFSAQAA